VRVLRHLEATAGQEDARGAEAMIRRFAGKTWTLVRCGKAILTEGISKMLCPRCVLAHGHHGKCEPNAAGKRFLEWRAQR